MQTLTGLNQSAVDTGTPATALPLWAISPSEYGAPYAYLDNVTLVLPVSDFLALYHPAKLLASGWDGCRKAPSGAPAYGLVDPRFRDISVFKVAPGSDPNAMINMVELVEYQGWGVRGTSVRVVPVVSVADIPLSTYQPCGGSGDDHDDNSLAIGVGVGVGVGGALLVAALIVLYLAYRRWVGRACSWVCWLVGAASRWVPDSWLPMSCCPHVLRVGASHCTGGDRCVVWRIPTYARLCTCGAN